RPPERRQPAEGGARQVAGAKAARAALRRADSGHRRGRQKRDLRPHGPAGRRRRGRADDLQRPGRDPRHERPRAGAPPRPAGWRATAGRVERTVRHAPGYRRPRPIMKRLLGILVLVLVLYGTILLSDPNAGSVQNHTNLARRLGHWGVLTLGVGILIISGGIDLSIGSVVGLRSVSLGLPFEAKVAPPA